MTSQVVSSGKHLILGDEVALPVSISNDLVRFTFVEHVVHGVTLDTMEQLADCAGFTWTNGQSSDDGAVTGKLWRIVQDSGNEHNAEHDAEHGSVGAILVPSSSVVAYEATDAAGRSGYAFRWEGLALATSGSVDVTVVATIADGETFARFSIYVDREHAATDADAIDHVAFPILALRGPVPARPAMSHAESQIRSRVLSDINRPLSSWVGIDELRQHPRGYSANGVTIETQAYQFDAIAAMDPDDSDSLRQVAVLSSADTRGWRKQFYRAGVADVDDALYLWEHRYMAPWSSWPILGPESQSRFGNSMFCPYPVLVGAFRAPTAAWDFSAAIWYRDNVAETMAAAPRRTDASRTAISRGAPLVISREDTANMDGTALGSVLSLWTEELRVQTGADVIFAEWHTLLPERVAGGGLTTDFSQLRGVNYLPMASTSNCLHLALLPIVASAGRPTTAGGFFHQSHLEDELDVLQGVGFQNIRIWGSLAGYICDPTGYMASLKIVAQQCNARGIKMTYVVFNQIPAGLATAGSSTATFYDVVNGSPSSLRTALWAACNAWQTNGDAPAAMPPGEQDISHWPEPKTGDEWGLGGPYGQWTDTAFQADVGAYVRAIASFFATDPDGMSAFESIDLYNEVNLVMRHSDASRDMVIDFICKVEDAMRLVFPGIVTTVGWAGDPTGLTTELAQLGCYLSYLSMHAYAYSATNESYASIQAVAGAVKDEADSLGIPAVLSEFYVRPENAGQLYKYDAILRSSGVAPMGWQMWCYIQNNAYRNGVESGTWDYGGFSYPFDGLVTCTKAMDDILTTDTLTFTTTGGEHNEEHSDEHNNGSLFEGADRDYLPNLFLDSEVVP